MTPQWGMNARKRVTVISLVRLRILSHRVMGTRDGGVGCSELKMLRHKEDLLLLLAVQVMDDPRPSKRKKLTCPRVGCSFMADNASIMKRHELRHRGIRPYSWYLDSCKYRAYTAANLKTH